MLLLDLLFIIIINKNHLHSDNFNFLILSCQLGLQYDISWIKMYYSAIPSTISQWNSGRWIRSLVTTSAALNKRRVALSFFCSAGLLRRRLLRADQRPLNRFATGAGALGNRPIVELRHWIGWRGSCSLKILWGSKCRSKSFKNGRVK